MLLFSADNETAETLQFTKLHTVPEGRSIGLHRSEMGDFKAFVGMLSKSGQRVDFEPLPVSEGDEMLFFVRRGRKARPTPSGFTIVRNAPPPPPREMKAWPFADMQVGDCVTIDDVVEGKRAQSYCHVFARSRTPHWKFVSRTVDGVMNIWRVK